MPWRADNPSTATCNSNKVPSYRIRLGSCCSEGSSGLSPGNSRATHCGGWTGTGMTIACVWPSALARILVSPGAYTLQEIQVHPDPAEVAGCQVRPRDAEVEDPAACP